MRQRTGPDRRPSVRRRHRSGSRAVARGVNRPRSGLRKQARESVLNMFAVLFAVPCRRCLPMRSFGARMRRIQIPPSRLEQQQFDPPQVIVSGNSFDGPLPWRAVSFSEPRSTSRLMAPLSPFSIPRSATAVADASRLAARVRRPELGTAVAARSCRAGACARSLRARYLGDGGLG